MSRDAVHTGAGEVAGGEVRYSARETHGRPRVALAAATLTMLHEQTQSAVRPISRRVRGEGDRAFTR